MRVFTCQACGQLLYFENVRCERCGRSLGFLPDLMTISAIEPNGGESWKVLAARGALYRFCENQKFAVCNWMVAAESEECFCTACRHNQTIPDLSLSENAGLWQKLEAAKHRLFYTLMNLRMPLSNRTDDPEHGLAFSFLAEFPGAHSQRVMTGHDNGLITLAVREADDANRESI